ncbi:hypothetical protein RI543_000268 [Arxiozyma heterogenica]|uniref:Uncharacterized protein n=1 Tax=Arxiozyma heterogenica TaxID=278026 RepID=A0AAN7WT67_9SACH|nr:hypothetical protein RI543_000268 [Kazachstania heterogenica]
MFSRKSSKITLTDWDVDTLLSISKEIVIIKENNALNIEERDVIRTSTKLPCSKIENVFLEEPPCFQNNGIKLVPEKNRDTCNRSLKNHGVP